MKLSPQTLSAAGALLTGAFCVGWLAGSGASGSGAVGTEGDVVLPRVRHDGEIAGDAGERFALLGYGRADVQPSSDPDIAPAPPPPDITAVFRRDLTAIEQTPRGPIVWVVDLAQFSSRRSLRTGDVYKDGWRVSAISAQFIELRKRHDVRRVAIFDASQDETP